MRNYLSWRLKEVLTLNKAPYIRNLSIRKDILPVLAILFGPNVDGWNEGSHELLIIEDFVLWGEDCLGGPALKEEMWDFSWKIAMTSWLPPGEVKLQSQEDGARDWELEANAKLLGRASRNSQWVGNEDSLIVEQVWNRMPEKIWNKGL